MNLQLLLDFIGKLESNGNYNAVWGNAHSIVDLSKYTLSQLEKKQRLWGRRGSSATGKYQFMRKTLLLLRVRMLLSGDLYFTPELQEKLAMQLLKRRGLNRWLRKGVIDDDRFMDSLSKEWASLPYHTGRSYYDGDGLNHALASREEFRAILGATRNSTQ